MTNPSQLSPTIGLLEQVDRGRAQEKEPSRPASQAPTFVDHTTYGLENIGTTMNLVQNHELVFMFSEIKLGFGELGLVARRLQFEIDRWSPGGYVQSESRLANLARSQQGNRRIHADRFHKLWADASVDHPCNCIGSL